jgi:OmpA-OmpF porin, OOP family
MNKKVFLIMVIMILTLAHTGVAQNTPEIISLFKGSDSIFDDKIGFETHYYLTGNTSYEKVEGTMRRQFASVPKGVSAYEVIKNYEKAILSKGGTVFHISRNANSYTDKETGKKIAFMKDYFSKGRVEDRGLSNMKLWAYANLPIEAETYVAGKVSTPQNDVFISVSAAVFSNTTYYSLVTVIAEAMDLDNVTMSLMNEKIGQTGRVAIYDIFFDTGTAEIKKESSAALQVISDYLKKNPDKLFLMVGHTDNTGNFSANMKLSMDRANAVTQRLVTNYGIRADQVKPVGVGPACPQMSNSTDKGRAKNRRVELVEL